MTSLHINGERLYASLMELGKIGGTTKGGSCRVALTAEDAAGREWFMKEARASGLTVTMDEVGNIFCRREGKDPDAPAVTFGSHIDTQPTGGKFDGCFGVMSGLEVMRTLNDHGITTEAPLEVIAWMNEEGSRFAPCMMGSGVFCKQLDKETVLKTTDFEGITVEEALIATGSKGTKKSEVTYPIGTYFEAHIEQGPYLEETDNRIGVVLGTLAQKWYEVTLTGVDSHAGACPMPYRHDSMVAAAEITLAVNKIGKSWGEHARGTVGIIKAIPGSRNVVSGNVMMTLDIRHWEDEKLAVMEKELFAAVEEAAKRQGVTAHIEKTADFPALHFNEECISAVRESAAEAGLSHMDIISGAGHDAIYMAEICPTSMIFIPCRGGISHNETEYASPEWVAAGGDVLLNAVLKRAGV